MSNAPGKSEIFSERVVGRNDIGKKREEHFHKCWSSNDNSKHFI